MAGEFAFIDHYDSFSRNVIDWLLDPLLPREARIVPHDDAAAMAALTANPIPLVFSPGPKSPAEAPGSMALLRASLGRVPILGVCLGHQMLGVAAGLTVAPVRAPRHGMTRAVRFAPDVPLFAGLPSPAPMAAYNSLGVLPGAMPPHWRAVAWCENDEIQALAYEPPGRPPAYGVQFHPESFLSPDGPLLAANWRKLLAPWLADACGPAEKSR